MKQNISENNLLYEYRMLYRMKLYTEGTEEYTKGRDQGALDSKTFGKIEG